MHVVETSCGGNPTRNINKMMQMSNLTPKKIRTDKRGAAQEGGNMPPTAVETLAPPGQDDEKMVASVATQEVGKMTHKRSQGQGWLTKRCRGRKVKG
jgi:hypothetical protein